MSRYPTSRNFGYGKQITWAGHQALRDYYGQGHFATVQAHFLRWRQFCRWLCDFHDIRDARDVEQAHLDTYADLLRQRVAEESMEVAYAQNLLSSANTTIKALCGATSLRIDSPSDWVGERHTARRSPPTGVDWNQVEVALADIREEGLLRAACVVELARSFGLRLREAILGDIDRWSREAKEKNAIDIREGTKGGRGNEVERWVPVSEKGLRALFTATEVRSQLGCGANLLHPNENYDGLVNDGEINRARRHLHRHGIKGYHDLRAAWACERYEQLAGLPAPVLNPPRKITYNGYYKTTETLAKEMGHDRQDVLAAYVGPARLW